MLRILRANGLTLAPHTARRPGRTHDGTVVALRSNVRWCSDHLELPAGTVRSSACCSPIDACAREIMAWSATTTGVSAEMACDLMIACCERRVRRDEDPTPQSSGCPTTAPPPSPRRQHRRPPHSAYGCCSPRCVSPRSNGIAEAFVKTLKRDYARLAILSRRRDVMRLLPAWFEDYITIHPHSGLRMLSPREYLSRSA